MDCQSEYSDTSDTTFQDEESESEPDDDVSNFLKELSFNETGILNNKPEIYEDVASRGGYKKQEGGSFNNSLFISSIFGLIIVTSTVIFGSIR
jgi:hypothetical protein